jgi:hypothetical protein
MFKVLGSIFGAMFAVGFFAILAGWFFLVLASPLVLTIAVIIAVLLIALKVKKTINEGFNFNFFTILDAIALLILAIFVAAPFVGLMNTCEANPAYEALTYKASFGVFIAAPFSVGYFIIKGFIKAIF